MLTICGHGLRLFAPPDLLCQQHDEISRFKMSMTSINIASPTLSSWVLNQKEKITFGRGYSNWFIVCNKWRLHPFMSIFYPCFLDALSHLYKWVCLSARPSVTHEFSWKNHAKVPFLTKTTISTGENASYAVYPVLFRCDHASLKEFVSVRPSVRKSRSSWNHEKSDLLAVKR